ncbi:DUF862-domain-containing protein [Daedalea quercina L-15889]|uniref:DUF862-domain-containing protein n=1 Tax=Daedalea quercina L-15889 TaxID=1314783 RepID=A0A165TUH9_9APHY|nr:DUF862-domain-containing protein [Daedalea quercina L-15889]
MTTPVQLYVYDLSNGLAKRLSLSLTGKQIDGIWHTSVVVFGREIFYGQGILETRPGQSHHGKPLHMIDIGETAIDEDTFNEYLAEISQHYTADKYHLLDFNCNSFTNDVIGFLTGGSIPSWIKDLPSDFLSTPFGAALRPTIDNMFRRPIPGAAPTPATLQPSPAATQAAVNASPNPALAASLLQAVASQAFSPSASVNGTGSSAPAPATQPQTSSSTSTVSAPVHICTNPSSFHSLLRSHRAVIAMFTSATCGPCRMIEPVFEDLAWSKTHGVGKDRVAFVKIDMGVGLGSQVASEFSVRVTPTFLFLLDEQKTYEFKGADSSELRSQTDLLLFQAFPPHPHTKLSFPAVEALSSEPILFTQVPALDSVISKLASFVDGSSSPSETVAAKEKLSQSFPVYLKARFPANKGAQPPKNLSANPQLIASWAEATRTIASVLPAAQLFPLVDLWRLSLLDQPIATWCSAATSQTNPVHIFMSKAIDALHTADMSARNTVLVTLRLLANATSNTALVRSLLSAAGHRAETTKVLVSSLLHADASVRTAAASLAFNVAAYLQKGRMDRLRGDSSAAGMEVEEDGDWEVELVSAVLEALSNETHSEEVGTSFRAAA